MDIILVGIFLVDFYIFILVLMNFGIFRLVGLGVDFKIMVKIFVNEYVKLVFLLFKNVWD